MSTELSPDRDRPLGAVESSRERAEVLDDLRAGLRSIKRNGGASLDEVIRGMRQRYGIPEAVR
ncbi:MAG TPA: hypothetical protein VMF30_00945 [Pirellulales bacterium]|nr:hypothetical protein [Pirellulales bacterium]